MSQENDIVEQRHLWPHLIDVDQEGPFLIGGRCSRCGFVTLGQRDVCPQCWNRNSMQQMPIGRTGTLYTYTVIHQLPEGFTEPFAVGYVDVEEQVRVFAHLVNSDESLRVGQRVVLEMAALRPDGEGGWLYGPRYRAADNGD